MINMSVIKVIARFFTMLVIGTAAGLIASAIMNIYYHLKFSNIAGARDLRNWMIMGGCIGVVGGLVFNRLTLPRGLLRGDMQTAFLVFVRLIVIGLLITGVSMAIWFYYKVDYFPLKDNGPLSLIVGLLFAMWDLLLRTSERIRERKL
jgi:hypothetical protein